jgi:glycerol dehydrogenase-like iron-containing ADH family enzyme
MNIEYGHDFLEQQLPKDREILAVVTEPLLERMRSNFKNHNIHPFRPPEMEEKELDGELVALGILLMSALQENELPRIKALIDSLGIRYRPEDLNLSHKALVNSLVGARTFVQNQDLPFSILYHLSIDHKKAERLIECIYGP